MCGAACEPSTTVVIPRLRASRQMSATGLMVPSTLLTWASASSFTSGVIAADSASRSRLPSGSSSATLMVAPVRWAMSCQGTMLAWCSIRVTRMASPAFSCGRPHEYATRLMAKVVPLHRISSSVRTLRKRASLPRAPS